jgi:hypothetical protein
MNSGVFVFWVFFFFFVVMVSITRIQISEIKQMWPETMGRNQMLKKRQTCP